MVSNSLQIWWTKLTTTLNFRASFSLSLIYFWKTVSTWKWGFHSPKGFHCDICTLPPRLQSGQMQGIYVLTVRFGKYDFENLVKCGEYIVRKLNLSNCIGTGNREANGESSNSLQQVGWLEFKKKIPVHKVVCWKLCPFQTSPQDPPEHWMKNMLYIPGMRSRSK